MVLVNGGLRAGVAGRERAVLADKGYVQPEMVPAELNHPRLRGRRLAEKGNVIFIAAERRPATRRLQQLIGLDDLIDFFVALRTQRRRQHRHGGVLLRLGEIAHAQTGASESSRRQIRPALALRVVFEIKYDFATLGIIKCGEEFFCRGNNFSRRVVRRCAPFGKGGKDESTAEEDQH